MSRITDDTKKAIVALRASGVPNVEVAQKFGLHPVTTSRIFSRARAGVQAEKAREARQEADYAVDLRRKAYGALEAGLEAPEEPYKRADIGLKTLKGLGEFDDDPRQINLHIEQLAAGIPEAWRHRYFGTVDPTDESH